jgi:anti-sigma factor RsiW
MNKCMNSEIQDLLPDLEHGKLTAAGRQSVEAHLAGCDSCREDLRIIRTVKSATVFAPNINIDGVVRQIPPYRMPVPAREMPARGRLTEWLVAATVGVLLIGAGTVLKNRQPTERYPTVAIDSPPSVNLPESVSLVEPNPDLATASATHTPALALAADVRDLSDGNLQQLMDELENFDALPNSEPEPVFAVDTSEGR